MFDGQSISPFRNALGETIFRNKYMHEGCETWPDLARTVVEDVCGGLLGRDDRDELVRMVAAMEFIPGGRYLYYAGRQVKAYNNCMLLRAEEDSREDWANLSHRVISCLMTGAGIGVDFSVYRAEGERLSRTGGIASGPISKMRMTNEEGRVIMQGGSRRSAMWGGLDADHPDARKLLHAKDWASMPIPGTSATYADAKAADFNFPAPLDMMNVSLLYSDRWLHGDRMGGIFVDNCRQALRTGEPGFAFNFGAKSRETLRNACTELTSEDDSDVCNLGSVNMSRIGSLSRFRDVVRLGTMFLLCGTITGHVPYRKVERVREKNRRLGLGLMGMHEWLLVRGHRYGMNPELRGWMEAYRDESRAAADGLADRLDVSRPAAVRAIAPTGTIGILAGTTTGIEPIYAVALKRRYLRGGADWRYQYVVDSTAKLLMDIHGIDPEGIETAVDLARDPRRRIEFQADVQDHVDHAISSTINLPAWGSEDNNEDHVLPFARTLAEFAPRLRGFTAYPDGSRGGQPLTAVPYGEAEGQEGVEFREFDSCKGGVCGI